MLDSLKGTYIEDKVAYVKARTDQKLELHNWTHLHPPLHSHPDGQHWTLKQADQHQTQIHPPENVNQSTKRRSSTVHPSKERIK